MVGQRTVIANQQQHHDALTSQEVTLRALYAAVEVTVRRAAREQRQGRSMAFDEICAMPTSTSVDQFPHAEVFAVPSTNGTRSPSGRSNAVWDRETGTSVSAFHVRYHRLLLPHPDQTSPLQAATSHSSDTPDITLTSPVVADATGRVYKYPPARCRRGP